MKRPGSSPGSMNLPLPAIGVSSGLGPFAAIAISMIAITIVVLGLVLRTERGPPLLTQMLLALAVLLGGTVLLLALLFIFIDSDGTTAWTWVLVAFNFMMMVPLGLWFIGLIVFRDRRVSPRAWAWPVSLGVTVTGSEALMGVLFAYGGANGTLSVVATFGLGLSSIWFFWSMAAVMTALTVWAPQPAAGRAGALALTLASVVSPWVTAYPIVGVLAMSVVMVGWFAMLARLLRLRRIVPGEASLVAWISVAFLAMGAAGALVAATGGSMLAATVFGTVMGLAMIGEVAYLVRACYGGPVVRPWTEGVPGADPGASAPPPVPRTAVEPRS